MKTIYFGENILGLNIQHDESLRYLIEDHYVMTKEEMYKLVRLGIGIEEFDKNIADIKKNAKKRTLDMFGNKITKTKQEVIDYEIMDYVSDELGELLNEIPRDEEGNLI